MYELEHEQTPFMTWDGKEVLVDAGMLAILEELKRHGVRTQFSCQGGDYAPYVVGTTKTFMPLLRRVRDMYLAREYSSLDAEIVENFLTSCRDLDVKLDWYIPWRGIRWYKSIRVYYKCTAVKFLPDYIVERQFQTLNFYGRRTTLRWPVVDNVAVYNLLCATPTSRS